MKPRELQHEAGEQVGSFALERLLGQGASAEVWLVNEQGEMGFTKRQALKILRPPPGDIEGHKKALINEARVCGRLKHRGLVDVYRVGEHEGELYIAMEYVDGPDLNTLLSTLRRRSIPVPARAALEAAIELAEALEHAHTRTDDDGQLLGIVHRDLKPSNVLVEREGTLKISDWGLVKSSLNIESTNRGVVKGTPGYIAPEVWGGTRDFKPTADLFALGAMLFEMVVGERLFRGKNLARIAEQVARRKPDEEAARVRDRCPALEPVMTRMLQRAPQHRYKTAAEFSHALRPIRDRHPAEEGLQAFLVSIREIVDDLGPLASRSTQPPSVEGARPEVPNLAGPTPQPTSKPSGGTAKRAPFTRPAGTASEVAENTDSHPAAEPPETAVQAASVVDDRWPEPGPTRPAGPSLEVGETRLVPPDGIRQVVPSEGVVSARREGAGKPQREARKRPGGAPRRSGPSTGLGVGVALLGLVLLAVGLFAYFNVGV